MGPIESTKQGRLESSINLRSQYLSKYRKGLNASAKRQIEVKRKEKIGQFKK